MENIGRGCVCVWGGGGGGGGGGQEGGARCMWKWWMGGDKSIWGHNIVGGKWGDEGMNPKLIQKLSWGADSYVTITWKGFSTVFQVLSTSILAFGSAKGSKQEGAPCTFSNTRNLSCLDCLPTACHRLTSDARNQLLGISMKSSAITNLLRVERHENH